MTVQELIDALKKCPPEAAVQVRGNYIFECPGISYLKEKTGLPSEPEKCDLIYIEV